MTTVTPAATVWTPQPLRSHNATTRSTQPTFGQRISQMRRERRLDGFLGRPLPAITAVAVVPPRLRPAWDGGEWTEDEVWTIRLPHTDGAVYMLHDKPHRVSWWAEGEPGRDVLERVPVSLLDGVRVTDRFGVIRWEGERDRRAYRLWRYRNRRRWWIDA